jgi:hypothetical protein
MNELIYANRGVAELDTASPNKSKAMESTPRITYSARRLVANSCDRAVLAYASRNSY